MSATRQHEDALGRLQNLYKRVRAKMYRDHKSAVIAEDNSKLQQFQGGCPKPKEVASKAELDAQAQCMQKEAREVDNSDLGLLMRRHLKEPVAPLPAGQACSAFRQVDLSQLEREAHGRQQLHSRASTPADGTLSHDPPRAATGPRCARAVLSPYCALQGVRCSRFMY